MRLPRNFSTKGRKGGKPLYYWSPSPGLRKLGFRDKRLDDDKAVAIRQAEALNEEAERAREAAAVGPAGGPVPGTVNWLIEQYLAHDDFTELAERTQADYRRMPGMFARIGGNERLEDVTPQALQAIKRAGASTPWQTNYLLRVIRLLFAFGVRQGYCDRNPAQAFRQLKTPPRQAIWSHEQEERFLSACERLRRPSIRLAYLLAVWTAQREGDVLRMAWSDYEDGALHVRQGKTGRRLVIPVMGPLAEALASAPRVSSLILVTERGGPWKPYHFRHTVKRIVRAAGVEGVRFADLRRTAIVRLAEAGCTVPEISAISGHQIDYCQRILEVYLPRTRQMAQSAVVKLVARHRRSVGEP